jgi:uncharacterized cupredoxin-like copper-binding protein
MGGKGRRRGGRRRARQQQEQRPERAPDTENVPAGEPAPAAPQAEAGHSRAARKRAKQGGGLWGRGGRIRVSPWLIAVFVVAIGAGILAVLILSSGSSGTTGGESTADPRVAGQTPDASVSLNVDDVNFSNTELTGNAGEVIEFLVTNTGTISHNLVVAGPDNEYGTGDEFEPETFAIKPGETGQVLVKIDDPGTYKFRCAFHPLIEFGTLVLK